MSLVYISRFFLGIIFSKCTEVEDAIEEEITKAEALFMHRFTIQQFFSPDNMYMLLDS